jgi:hypothetical protein
MAEYYTKFSFGVESPSKAAQDYALDLAAKAQQHYWNGETEPPPVDFPPSLLARLEELEYVDWGFTIEGMEDGIWLVAGYDGGRPDVACLLVQHLLQMFNPEGRNVRMVS